MATLLPTLPVVQKLEQWSGPKCPHILVFDDPDPVATGAAAREPHRTRRKRQQRPAGRAVWDGKLERRDGGERAEQFDLHLPRHHAVVEHAHIGEQHDTSGTDGGSPWEQRARGRVDVLALGFHVTYWDYLGWHDPFSPPEATKRQRDYGTAMRGSIYTSQVVINGTHDVVGIRFKTIDFCTNFQNLAVLLWKFQCHAAKKN